MSTPTGNRALRLDHRREDLPIGNLPGLELHTTASFPDMAELLEAIIVWAVELLQADAGEIFLWDEEKGRLVQAIGYAWMERYIGLELKPGEGLVGRVFASGKPMIVDDYATWPGRLEVYVLDQPVTDLTVPMTWQGRTIGVLGITADARRRIFCKEDIRPAALFANLAALTIYNHRLYGTLQDRAHKMKATLEREVAERTAQLAQRTEQLAHRALQLETSARVSQQLTSILDIETLVSSVVNLISEAFGYPYVHIYLRDGDSDTLAMRASTVIAMESCRPLKIGEGPLKGLSAHTSQPILVNDMSLHPQFLADRGAARDTQSELIIPLRMGRRVLGILDVQSHKRDPFSREDIRLIQSLGDQIAIAIENAHLYDQRRQLAALEARSYLARELHDSVAQLLFSITLTSDAARMLVTRDISRVDLQLERLQALAHQALAEMRALIRHMQPQPGSERSLVAQLRDLAAEQEERDGVRVELRVEGERALSARYELALYRIAQEALNNVVKHAQTNTATVTLRFHGTSVLLVIEDQGRGFDPSSVQQETRTLGLTSMRERAKLMRGVFDVESRPGSGTRIRVEIPEIDEE